MSASVFSAEGGGHHRGESKRKRRNSENKKIEAQEEGKEQKKIMAGRGRADSVGSSSEDETDANGRSVKKQLLSFWLTMEEKEKSEGSGFVRVQQQGRANKGPTGGRGHSGGLKHRSRSFDNKNDFLDELTSASPPSTNTDQGDDTKEHHLTVGSPSSGSSARRGRGHHHHHPLNTRGGSGGRGLQTFHARNHSFSSPMPFHLTTTTATSLPSSPVTAAMSPPSPLNASSPPPAASSSFSPVTASLRHFSSSPSLPAVGPLALPFRFGPDAQADLRRSASGHGEEEWERGDGEDEEKKEKEKEAKVARVVVPIEKGRGEEKEERKQEEEETKVEEKKEEPRKREEVVVVVESIEEDEREKKESAEDRMKTPVTKANSFRHSPTFLALQQALDDEKRQEKKEAAKQLSIAQSASASTLRVEPRPATSPTPARAAAISPPSNDPSKIMLGATKSDGPSTSSASEDAKQAQEAREKESAAAAAADEERSTREAERKKQEEEETKRREEEEAATKRKAEEELKRKEEAAKRAAEEEQKRKEEAAQREKEQSEQKEREERAEREAAERARKKEEEEAKERQAQLEHEEKAKKEEEARQHEEERRRQAEDLEDKRRQRQKEEEEAKRKLVQEEKKQEAAQRTPSGASSSDSAERAEESDKGGADVEARLEEVRRTYDARLAEEAKKLQLAEAALCAEREKRRDLEKQNKKLLERLRETELLLKIAQQKEKKLRLEKKRRSEEDEDLKNTAAAKKANAKATKKPKSEDDSDEDDDDDAKQQADDQQAKTKNTSTGESESDSAPPSLETSTSGVPTRTTAASKPQRLRGRASQSDQETDTTEGETDATETEEDTSDDSSASSEETSDSESTDDDDEGECEVSESDTTADEAKQMERRKTKVPAVVLVDMPLRRSAEKKKSGTRKANSEGEDDKTEDDVADVRAKTSREYVKQAHHRAKAANDSMTKDLMDLDDQRSAKRKSSRSGKDKGMAEKSEAKTAKKEKKERKKDEECDDDEVASTTTATKKLSRKMMKKNHGSLLRVFKGKAKKSSSPRANETAPSGLAKQIAKQRKKAQKEMEEQEREKEKKEKKRRAREERKRREEEEEAAAAAVEEERQQQHKQSLLSPSAGHRPRGASFDHRMDDADWEWQISETDSVTDESDVDQKAARQQREKERREVLNAKGVCSASSPNLMTAPFVTPPPPPPPPGGIRSSHAATSSPPTPPLPPPAHSISLPSFRRKNSSNASSPPAQQSAELSPTGEDKETPRGRAQRRTIAVPNKEKRKKREKARSKEDSDASFDSSSDVEARKRSAHTADHPSVNWRLSMKPGELMQFGSFLELRPTKEVITKRPKGIFGAPLESLCDAQAPIPSFLEQAFLYLEEKALRTTGLFDWDVEASTVQFLRSALEGTGEVDFDSYGTHAVAELLKHFLECLPEPLIPRHLYTAFVASSDVQCRNFKVNAVHQHLSQLSVHARDLVQRLCGFLALYIKHSAHNKTTAGKLSAVFGPLVLRPAEEEGFKDTSFIQLNSSRTKRKCASAFQVLIAEYETLFLHMPQVARYVVKDGQVLLQAAALPQLVEQMLDENFKEAGVADIVFLTHTYFTTSVDLLRELISIFDKNRKAEGKTWSHRLRMRILQLLKDWVVAYGTDLAEDADFVNAINKFTKPGADSKCSPIAEEDGLFAQIRFLLFSLEQKRKAPARLIRNLSSLNGVLLQGQGPLSLNLHGVKQSCASSLPPSPHGAQSQEDLARVKSSDTLNIWASSPTILSGLPRTYSGSGTSYTTTPRTSQPSSPYHSSSSVATRAPQSDNEDDESTQYDTQGEEEDSADDSDAAVGEERPSRDLARQVRIGDDEFLDLDAEETAKQLTLIDNQLFRGIPKKELLNKRFMTPDTSPHFTAMVQRFNLTASWVGSVVFEYEQPARRAKAISLLIDICQASLRLNNYNTVFALLAGLNNTAVSRLRLTWERVSRKHMRRFKEMMAVVSDAKNHSAYRQELLKARPPVVPYLALFSKDLFGVEESNTTITSDGLINFGKMRLIAKLVGHFTSCQVTFPIAIDPALRALLKGVQPLSENELYERSYRLEPRKNT